MATRQTKAQLQAELYALKMENSTLRTQIDTLRAENTQLRVKYADIIAQPLPSERRYPHVDHRARHYRVENHGGREIKCCQP